MRYIVLFAAGLGSISLAYAEPNNVLYELQERCGKRAAEVFEKEWNGQHIVPTKDGGYLTADFENHYSPRLNKCFYLQKSGSVSKLMGIESLELYDLNENRKLGNFTTGNRLGITECQVQGKNCRSEQEWRELAKPFLEE